MAQLRIQMLGGLTVHHAHDATPVTRFPTQKTAVLLALLSLSPGRRFPREVLIDRLWTDAAPEDGRRSLRVAIAALRRLLEPTGTPSGTILAACRESVSLCAGAFTTDVSEFETALRRGDTEAAQRLFAAGELLPALYDDFVLGERERLNNLFRGIPALAHRVAVAEALVVLPPATPRDPRERLPFYATRFVGRETERETFATLLADSANRLVTVTGTGGVGKTRFVCESLCALPRTKSVRYVPLADAVDVSTLLRRVAVAVQIEPAKADTRTVGYALFALGAARLVLDNMEQLGGGDCVSVIAAWLAECPELQIVTTSRQRLMLPGERELILEPLATPTLPATPERLLDFAAVRLFLDRARVTRPDAVMTPRNAETVSALCVRLGGLPLALEITAAWAGVLTFAQMLSHVEAHLLNDAGPAAAHRRAARPERHRTLRAALDVSLSLLSPSLTTAFVCLAVFRGGFTANAANAVLGDEHGSSETLTRLRERSLLAVEWDESTDALRFHFLPAVHEYARERFAGGAIVAAHMAYYLALAEAPRTCETVLDADFGNLCAALDHAATVPDESELRFCVALHPFFRARGHNAVGLNYVLRALDRADSGSAVYRRAVVYAGNLSYDTGAFETSRTFHQTALALAESADDARTCGCALQGIAAIVLYLDADCAGALALCEWARAQFRFVESVRDEAGLLLSMATIADTTGDEEGAFGYYRAALALAQECGDLLLQAHAHQRLGGALGGYCDAPETRDARLIEAKDELNTAIAQFETLGNRVGVANARHELANVAWEANDYDTAMTGYEFALGVYGASGDTWSAAVVLNNLGRLNAECGAFARAATYFGGSLNLRVRIADKHALLLCVDAVINFLVAMATQHGKAFRRDHAAGAVKLRAADRALRAAYGFGNARPDDGLRPLENTFAKRLGTADFARAASDGANLSLDDAVAAVRGVLAKVR